MNNLNYAANLPTSHLVYTVFFKRCNALRLLHPTSLRQFAEVGRLSAMPCQSNKRGDLRPDSSYVPPLYRHTLSGAA